MKHPRSLVALLIVVLSFGGCASLGTGDPVVVRAEDVQVNSLSFYDSAMQWHFANSTKESPALYKAFETFRVQFPPAWKSLSLAIPAYKTNKGTDLASALAAVEKLTNDIRAIWTPAPKGGTSWIFSPSSSGSSASLRKWSNAALSPGS